MLEITVPSAINDEPTSRVIKLIPTGVYIEGYPNGHSQNITTQVIVDEIKSSGRAIPYSRFMELSLYGPDGYYSSAKAKIGGEVSHFTTSPEMSPLFGESIAVNIISTWEAMGKPDRFDILEMGAGRGTMAVTVLQALQRREPALYDAIRYLIVEYGDLISQQQSSAQSGNVTEKIRWIQGSATELPVRHLRGAIISNELPDAFPVEIVHRNDNNELLQGFINIDENGQWCVEWKQLNSEVQKYIDRFDLNIALGVVAINIRAASWQEQVAAALDQGMLLTIDYGSNTRGEALSGDNFGLRYYGFFPDGKRVNSKDGSLQFADPGGSDITANVDFGVLGLVAEQSGLKQVYDGGQQAWLLSSGLEAMAETQILRPMQDARSWKELMGFSWAYEDCCELYRHSVFYVQISSTPEINLDLQLDPNRAESGLLCERRPRLFIGLQHSGVAVSCIGRDMRSYSLGNVSLDGYINTNILPRLAGLARFLDRAKLVDSKNFEKVLVDFNDEAQVRAVVEASGFVYE